MSALIVPIASVREAVRQTQQMKRPDLRNTAVDLVLDEVRRGHSGMCVAHHLREQKLRIRNEGAPA